MPVHSKPSGYILYTETQQDERTPFLHLQPLRVAPVLLQCLLFLRGVRPPITAGKGGDPAPIKDFTKVFNGMPLSPWQTNIQSLSWKDFQSSAMEFLAVHCFYLIPTIKEAKKDKKITWKASIAGHATYGPQDNFTILGQLKFRRFAAAAYVAFPSDILFELIMDNPRAQSEKDKPEYVWALALQGISADIRPGANLLASNVASLFAIKRKPVPDTGNVNGGGPNVSPKHCRVQPKQQEDDKLESNSNSLVAELLPPLSFSPFNPMLNKSPLAKATAQAPKEQRPLPPTYLDNVLCLETFLWIAPIAKDNQLTRARLTIHGITHWLFFNNLDEAEAIALGFPVGVARLLCKVVEQLDRYMDDKCKEEKAEMLNSILSLV
ncbi:hypothetical protein PCASD_08111 [Puccinia coronata f. sp. avenae]|uniref:Uncharacterized protein n=1 Tax=Puccinia coronata f. sp. avenae TaxID=200324 RepID=A0A2N5VAB8_9BASI|nr:hypothetical protein PCASD_08111 [Puccinia coronata f. sp. avenae]